ncbi:carboxymuconolactone decarboxylase family protein [Sinosporangium siamense]|uniref:Alkyl hydroperoxide reductase AhpD n=1 Tax=Sinosporangium siamense TaxID=1367973 RepID=A0A919REZ4_9ACTN|nr:carboxymuconolactone decarboxylase family protein [Sinosporangium siamense]GII92157.1 alkyl hydroperoxide reductase AhpD [Sinosporangium siamense]
MTARLNVFAADNTPFQALASLDAFLAGCGVPASTLNLVKMRVSQINGCSPCLDRYAHKLHTAGESDERLFSVATWREAPWFTDAERAALGLAEEATRLADRPGAVPDQVWRKAGEHYDDADLSALVMAIAQINVWNRILTMTRVPPSAASRDA